MLYISKKKGIWRLHSYFNNSVLLGGLCNPCLLINSRSESSLTLPISITGWASPLPNPVQFYKQKIPHLTSWDRSQTNWRCPYNTFRKCCLWNTHFMLKLQPYSKDYCIFKSISKHKIEVWNPKHFWSQEFWIRNIQPPFKRNSRKSLWSAVTQSRPVPAEELQQRPLWNKTVIFIDMRVMFVGGQQYPKVCYA